MAGYFFTVVVQLLAGNRHLDLACLECCLHTVEQAPYFGITLLHRQLQVDHRLAAQPLTQPGFNQRGGTRRLLDDIAHHPVYRLLRLPGKAIGHQVLDQAGVHQAFGHRPVVDGRHQHATAHQLVGPATR
ncbi:hypothetical protein D3C76_1115980 [compost metagenome]